MRHLWLLLLPVSAFGFDRPPTPTLTLSAVPATVEAGGEALVTWSSTGTTSCAVSVGGVSAIVGTSGSQMTGPLEASITIQMMCSGAGGSVSRTADVIVTAAPEPDPEPEPDPDPPPPPIPGGETLTITGTGFGNGPNVVFYDDFDGGRVGSWAAQGCPSFSDSVLRGIRVTVNGDACQHTVTWPTSDSVYFSAKMYTPAGSQAPAGNSKTFWMGGVTSSTWHQNNGQPDLVFMNKINSGSPRIFNSNDGCCGRTNWDSSGWQSPTGAPYLASFWLSDSPTRATDGFARIVYTTGQINRDYSNGKPLIISTDNPKGWNLMNIAGYFGLNVGNSQFFAVDEVYVSTGPNAPARVEVCDSSTYAGCRNVVLCVPSSWTDTSITCRVPRNVSGWTAHVRNGADQHVLSRAIN